MGKKKSQAPSIPEFREFPIDRPDPGPASYSNHQVVQRNEHEVTIHFFQIGQPILLGTDEERLEQLNKIEKITAHPVGKIVMSHERFKNFCRMIAEHQDRMPKATDGNGSS